MNDSTRMAAKLLLQLPAHTIRQAVQKWVLRREAWVSVTGPLFYSWVLVERRRAIAYAKRALYLRGYDCCHD